MHLLTGPSTLDQSISQKEHLINYERGSVGVFGASTSRVEWAALTLLDRVQGQCCCFHRSASALQQEAADATLQR